ncbi:glycoside hydrolase family 27 protein [Actinokineospora sp. NBRC 105648]|uniref:glycoside hydrolase family 27 protein n=1 Tax=Actinokineospora sp. NBRC 105648 TaxID=3032206 RepID=UPI0024A30840|nr:glycoside hydrolase family 27 protein [Actinokineospora sp. NBRC 105648]GLZ38794.1 hypothetical protein Acsp05_24180 [Actinokineospora sp. NBRC 105648]
MNRARAVVELLAVVLVTGLAVAPGPATAPAVADNGLARTPPMGWNSWNAYGCDIDQDKIRAAVDALVTTGMREAGYRYVAIDDCWQADARTDTGALRADPTRFPDGIKALADHAHAVGLDLGLYATPGTRTCANIYAGYPGRLGSLGHERQDAATFAAWGVDYLKYDWCLAEQDGVDPQAGFTLMRDALAATGRPVVYSVHRQPQQPVDRWRPAVANLWRTTGDISADWGSVLDVLDRQVGLERYSRPGAWNDPDMLEVGNGPLTLAEDRAQFSLWALLNAPLLAGNDLTTMPESVRAVLTNPEVIAVDQDWAGTQGYRVFDDGDHEIWRKPLSGGDSAVVLLNRGTSAATVTATAEQLGFPGVTGFGLHDLWTGQTTTTRAGTISVSVPPHGVVFYRVSPDRG